MKSTFNQMSFAKMSSFKMSFNTSESFTVCIRFDYKIKYILIQVAKSKAIYRPKVDKMSNIINDEQV